MKKPRDSLFGITMISSSRVLTLRAPVFYAVRTILMTPYRSVRPHFPVPPRPADLVQTRFQHTQPPSSEQVEKRLKKLEDSQKVNIRSVFRWVQWGLWFIAASEFWLHLKNKKLERWNKEMERHRRRELESEKKLEESDKRIGDD